MRGPRMRVSGRHNCTKAHRSWLTMAECAFPTAEWVSGSGPHASLAKCRGLTVQLFGTAETAHEAKREIDSSGCGGMCMRAHEVVDLRVR